MHTGIQKYMDYKRVNVKIYSLKSLLNGQPTINR